MDTIFIEGLVFLGRHGVEDGERAKEQRFGIDIRIEQKPRDWEEKIANTYNYMDAREIVQHVVEKESFKLIETLAETIAQEILKNKLAESVSVTIRKLDLMPPAAAGVSIQRFR